MRSSKGSSARTKEKLMDFLERWFGLSPDGGDGTFELCLVAAAVTAIGVIVLQRKLQSA